MSNQVLEVVPFIGHENRPQLILHALRLDPIRLGDYARVYTLCDHGVSLGMDAFQEVGCVDCVVEELLQTHEISERAQEWHEQILLEGGDL